MIIPVPITALFAVLLSVLLTACASQHQEGATADTRKPTEPVAEIHPGMLQGYIPMDQRINSVEFVPVVPDSDSAVQLLDDAVSRKALALHNSLRWDLAAADGHLRFPAAANTFSCALDVEISEQNTPALYMLLRRTLTDLGLATYSAKKAYQRPRPFMLNNQAICTPDDEELLRGDGSYPSGHTAIGWGWAMILAELAPDRAEAILSRGRVFGDSRLVCNVHWHSDVVAGRLVAGGAVAMLHNNQEFKVAQQAAKVEIERAQSLGLNPSPDACRKEQEAMAIGF